MSEIRLKWKFNFRFFFGGFSWDLSNFLIDGKLQNWNYIINATFACRSRNLNLKFFHKSDFSAHASDDASDDEIGHRILSRNTKETTTLSLHMVISFCSTFKVLIAKRSLKHTKKFINYYQQFPLRVHLCSEQRAMDRHTIIDVFTLNAACCLWESG